MRPTDLRVGKRYFSAAVSGSFHRHMEVITAAVQELASLSIRVLSPADPRVVAQQGEFLFVASDRVRSVRLVQDRHLECIRAADFLWLVCPDGYVGQSASMEVGFAAAIGVPIYSTHAPSDLTLRQYVTIVPTLAEALRMLAVNSRTRRTEGVLIDPHASVEEAHRTLGRIETALTSSHRVGEPPRRVYHEIAELQATLRLPTCAH
jgi:hypothetical protein